MAFLRRNISYSMRRFKESPVRYLSIPVTAAAVGLVTNYIGVSMLFYPIQYTGASIVRWPEKPFGLFGWQGIVPCKRFAMCKIMVDVTLNKLLTVKEVFEPLEPKRMAEYLQQSLQGAVLGGWLPAPVVNLCLQRVAAEVIRKVESLVDLGQIVITGMTTDPAILGRFFQKVGKNELDFLVRSGTYFGFLLGLIQMWVWIMFPVYWTLPISGAVVGFITNWIAIKLIFEPVEPVAVGPFTLHGMFLSRQKEVSAEFSEYLANNLLTSEEMWSEILFGKNAAVFETIIREQLPFLTNSMVAAIVQNLRDELVNKDRHTHTRADSSSGLEPIEVEARDVQGKVVVVKLPPPVAVTEPVTAVVQAIIADKLHDEAILEQAAPLIGSKHVLHSYIDKKIALEELLIQRMSLLTPVEFERLLHPIFEEDELTLIAAGGVLGLAAGAFQWWINVIVDQRAAVKQALMESQPQGYPRQPSGPPFSRSLTTLSGGTAVYEPAKPPRVFNYRTSSEFWRLFRKMLFRR